MVLKTSWKADYTRELERAVRARSEGNEGMARVCARRAAGIVVGEYLLRRGFTGTHDSTYDRLSIFMGLLDIDGELKERCSHFLLKVNLDHRIPGDPDLVREAKWLEHALLNEANY